MHGLQHSQHTQLDTQQAHIIIIHRDTDHQLYLAKYS